MERLEKIHNIIKKLSQINNDKLSKDSFPYLIFYYDPSNRCCYLKGNNRGLLYFLKNLMDVATRELNIDQGRQYHKHFWGMELCEVSEGVPNEEIALFKHGTNYYKNYKEDKNIDIFNGALNQVRAVLKFLGPKLYNEISNGTRIHAVILLAVEKPEVMKNYLGKTWKKFLKSDDYEKGEIIGQALTEIFINPVVQYELIKKASQGFKELQQVIYKVVNKKQ